MKKALVMHPRDNVAVAITPLALGGSVRLPSGQVLVARERIAFGHKLATAPIAKGQPVVKYGEPIGLATADVAEGSHVHVHNLESCRGRGDLQ